jgi:hypothetical protein
LGGTLRGVATLEELEARVAALEASHADYRAVLAAVNALGLKVAGHQDETRRQHDEITASMHAVRDSLGERIRSLEDGQSEIKDLLIRALDKS